MREFIASPTKLLRAKLPKADRAAFEMGRVAMALEVVTQIRLLEEQTTYAVVEVAPIIAALHTIIRDGGFDTAELWDIYNRLSAMRRGEQPEPSPEETSPAASSGDQRPLSWHLEHASEFSARLDAPSPDDASEPSEPPRPLTDPSSLGPEEPSEEDLKAAYERGKDLGLIYGPEESGSRLLRRPRRGRRSRS